MWRYLTLLMLVGCSTTAKLLPGRAVVRSPKATAPRMLSIQSMAQPDPVITSPSVILLPASVNLMWDPSPSEEVTGYNVYYGWASHQYQWMETSSSNVFITLTNVEIGRDYWFAVTAYDAIGTESDFSPELEYTIPQQLGLTFDQPGDTLWASYDLIDWFPRQASLSSGMWKVTMQSGVNQEFYRSSTTSP